MLIPLIFWACEGHYKHLTSECRFHDDKWFATVLQQNIHLQQTQINKMNVASTAIQRQGAVSYDSAR